MHPPDSIERSLLAARLATLRGEYTSGQQLLADLEARSAALREQLLRIQGALQVLDEVLQAGRPAVQASQGSAA